MNDNIAPLWTIRPLDGVGALKFGLLRSEARLLLGPPTTTFRKGPFESNDADAYDTLGLHLNFDPADRLESVDAWGPSTIRFDDLPLLNVDADKLIQELQRRGFEHEDYIFHELGFALSVADGLVRGVSVFRSGQYDLNNPDSAASRANRAAAAFLRRKLNS